MVDLSHAVPSRPRRGWLTRPDPSPLTPLAGVWSATQRRWLWRHDLPLGIRLGSALTTAGGGFGCAANVTSATPFVGRDTVRATFCGRTKDYIRSNTLR